MAKIHTHYDNLKVARNAPIEVIRAAYKILSQKYHPDKHPGNDDAVRVMTIINTSYDVLSNPEKRRKHDQWIAKMESEDLAQTPVNPVPNDFGGNTNTNTNTNTRNDSIFTRLFVGLFGVLRGIFVWIFQYFIRIGVVVGIIWVISIVVDGSGDKRSPPPGPKPYQSIPVSARVEYVRPMAAPNGQAWPTYAGYVKGYRQLHTDGLSKLTVDNTQNDSDVFVKLVSLDGVEAYPVRQFYIPAFGKFTLSKIRAGNYDIRYRDLGSGGLSRSEAFELQEIHSYDGVQYSDTTMTLYKVSNGNMQTYGLSEAEF